MSKLQKTLCAIGEQCGFVDETQLSVLSGDERTRYRRLLVRYHEGREVVLVFRAAASIAAREASGWRCRDASVLASDADGWRVLGMPLSLPC